MLHRLVDWHERLNRRVFPISEGYVHAYEDTLRRESAAHRVLLLGGGREARGYFDPNWMAVAREIVCLDPDPDALRKNDLKARVQALGDQLPFADGSIDVIASRHVFEHLEDPMQVLQECCRVLAPGGVVVAALPNARSYVAAVASATPHWFHVFVNRLRGMSEAEEDTYPTFYRANSESDLRRLAVGVGLKVERLEHFTGSPAYTTFVPVGHLAMLAAHWALDRAASLKGLRLNIVVVLRKAARGS
jgi:SAM-dependent methyltransferase